MSKVDSLMAARISVRDLLAILKIPVQDEYWATEWMEMFSVAASMVAECVDWSSFSPLGTLFHISTASKTAKGQRVVVTFPGHLHAASIIMLQDNSDTVLMCRSATPF